VFIARSKITTTCDTLDETALATFGRAEDGG